MKIYTAYVDIPNHFSVTASSFEEATELAKQHVLVNMQVTVALQAPCQLGSKLECPYKEESCTGCHKRELDIPAGLIDKEIINRIKESTL